MTSVLLAEDDPAISEPLARALRREGYEVDVAADGPGTLEAAKNGGIDLIVLDIGLPRIDGLEVCRRIRSAGQSVPVLILTARADEVDTVIGLDAGADDYVTKPFRLAELLARVRALLRRPTGETPPVIRHGALTIHTATRTVIYGSTPMELRRREYALQLFLAREPTRVFSRSQLLQRVWGYPPRDASRTVESHASRLRCKLAAAGAVGWVPSTWGVGYCLAPRPQLLTRGSHERAS